jgi:four helix bundle protein
MLQLNHKKMNVWNKGMELVTNIYLVTKTFPKEEMFGLTNQLRRAAVSIVSNIAEGSARKSNVERKRFYEISRASLVEIDTQIEISYRLNYIDNARLDLINNLINHEFALLSNLISKT